MSKEQLQARQREKKRDIIQQPLRQGWQWVERQFRSKSGPSHSTLAANPQATGGSPSDTIPSHRTAHRFLEFPVPASEHLSLLEPPAQETICSRHGESLESVPVVIIEPSTRNDHTPPSPELRPYRAPDKLGEDHLLEALPQGNILNPPSKFVASPVSPSQEISPSSSRQAPEVTSLSNHDVPNDSPLPLRESDAGREQDRPPESLASFYRPPPSPAPRKSFDDEPIRAVNYGPTYNIETAVNVFSGVNYGSVTMISDDDFTVSYLYRLKVSVKADHMYYDEDGEAALNRSYCTPGTRIDVLEGVMVWAKDVSPSSEIVYWLSGHAGSGKTTIAYTIACQLETLINDGNTKVMLGASFFCSRQFLDTQSPSSIIRTIVYQLALRSKPFQTALKEHGRLETVHQGPRAQLMGLLITPWQKSAPARLAENEPCYVIPIDALDELKGTGGKDFLAILFEVVNQQGLSGLKFFVTSRSEPTLVKQITSFANKQVCRLEEVPLEQSSADIKLYLSKNLADCADECQIEQLVSDAAGLFIHAATVVEYLKGRGVEEQMSLLEGLLSDSSSPARQSCHTATATLDNLYLQILETSLVDPRDCNNPGVSQGCLSILHTLISTIERISITVAVSILNASTNQSDMVINNGIAEGVLHRLHAVLYSQGGKIMWFHKSFVDFLFDKSRSQRFFCNAEEFHYRLADGCFGVMSKQLRFNIADIPSSHQLDSENPLLSSTINANISAPLQYACANWSAHLVLASHEMLNCLAKTLSECLQLQILFWMEVMNLLGQRGRCERMLRDSQQLFSKSNGSAELVSSLADAAAFAAHHSTSKAALSTPHLYISSLATFCRHSAVVQTWRQQFVGIPGFISVQGSAGEALVTSIKMKSEVITLAVSPDGINTVVGLSDGQVQIWDLSTGEGVRVLEGHTDSVNAVAYSPDGTHVISGSGDKSVRVWDLSTGEVVRVLVGHTGWVRAVAYSPDGTHVISGSGDHSVRVWDLSTGEEVRVLEGHTDSVNAVAYSPDGTHAISGSYDKSVWVWDLSTGEVVRVLEGHTDWVQAVAYSPDGTHVISGSDDNSVQVWDLSTGEVVRVLEGHTHWVTAVAYSPDGTHVISGSNDKSVQVWDISTGEAVRVLEGHTDSVNAVAYSPDGTHVISGSNDKSVQVWDLSTGEEVRVPEGHTGWVNAVAYCPDGTHVISGSDDNSVRVWDISTGEEVRVLEGHTHWVTAVAYSPDGTHVISGSGDKSVRVWDLSTGEVVRVLVGHTGWVRAVAYSPDGTHVISGSGDHSVWVWDLSTGEAVSVLEGHTDSVNAVAYSPHYIRAATYYQTARLL